MVSQRQKSALFQKEAVERSEKVSGAAPWRPPFASDPPPAVLPPPHKPPHCSATVLQNLCLFRIVEAFNGSTVSDVMLSIVATAGLPPKLVMPRVIQDNKKVLYRVSAAACHAAPHCLFVCVLGGCSTCALACITCLHEHAHTVFALCVCVLGRTTPHRHHPTCMQLFTRFQNTTRVVGRGGEVM